MSEVAKRLYATDETFREVADLLFGGGGDELVSKLSPTQEQKRNRRQAQIGLASNALGITAGTAALGTAIKDFRDPKIRNEAGPISGKIARYIKTPKGKARLITAAAGGAVALQGANLVGDAVANRVLARESKKGKITKSEPGSSDLCLPKGKLKQISENFGAKSAAEQPKVKIGHKHGKHKVEKGWRSVAAELPDEFAHMKQARARYRSGNWALKPKYTIKGPASELDASTADPDAPFKFQYGGGMTRSGKIAAGTAGAAAATGTAVAAHKKKKVRKSITWEGEISKVDEDKRQVFGWASIVEMNGQPVVDLQGDYIDIDEIEKSAYDYVIKSRKGGEMHRRDGLEPVHVSDMIESFLVTPEKKEKMGLPDSVPTGWWVGYQINDDDAWDLVKSGKRTGFSIHGRGQRTPDVI